MRARTRKLLLRAGAVIVLLGAVVPGVTYVGHWPAGSAAHATHSEAEAAEHAAHCHGPSSCAGQSAPGVWWTAGGPGPVESETAEHALDAAADPADTEAPSFRIIHPPRAA